MFSFSGEENGRGRGGLDFTEESSREERKDIIHVPFLYQHYNLDLDIFKR